MSVGPLAEPLVHPVAVTDGTLYSTEGSCVTCAAGGGAIVPIPPSVAVSFSPSSSAFCEVHLTTKHFQGTTHDKGAYAMEETGGEVVFGPLYHTGVTTDSSGAFSGAALSLFDATAAISFTIGGVTTPFVQIAC